MHGLLKSLKTVFRTMAAIYFLFTFRFKSIINTYIIIKCLGFILNCLYNPNTNFEMSIHSKCICVNF